MIRKAWAASLLLAGCISSGFGAERPPILGVAHIGLKTDNLAASRKFYSGILGFQEPFTVDKPSGGLMLTYFKVNDHQYIEVFPELKSPDEDRLSHIAFETTDARQLRDYMASHGLSVPVKLAPGLDGTLLATNGSSAQPYGQWVHDLMERGRTGRVLILDIDSGRVRTIASKLQYAFGACVAGDNVLVSESWRHRLVAIAADGSQRAVLDNLPVYPSRLSPAAASGFWLPLPVNPWSLQVRAHGDPS